MHPVCSPDRVSGVSRPHSLTLPRATRLDPRLAMVSSCVLTLCFAAFATSGAKKMRADVRVCLDGEDGRGGSGMDCCDLLSCPAGCSPMVL